jgi:hypothetical protein
MIEVVPRSVNLTDPIQPYEAKPVGLQLSVLDGGQYLMFSGEVRVKTSRQKSSPIGRVELRIKDRNGGTDCGQCIIQTHFAGTASGFDDSFNVRIQAPALALHRLKGLVLWFLVPALC